MPDIELSEFYQLIIAELNRSKKKDNFEDFRKKISKIFNNTKKKNRNDTVLITRALTKKEIEELQQIMNSWKSNSKKEVGKSNSKKEVGKLIQTNLKLFEFIKMYNIIGNFNIAKIKNILNTLAEQNQNNKSNITKNNITKITFEELYKIFHFFY